MINNFVNGFTRMWSKFPKQLVVRDIWKFWTESVMISLSKTQLATRGQFQYEYSSYQCRKTPLTSVLYNGSLFTWKWWSLLPSDIPQLPGWIRNRGFQASISVSINGDVPTFDVTMVSLQTLRLVRQQAAKGQGWGAPNQFLPFRYPPPGFPCFSKCQNTSYLLNTT